MTQTSWEGKDYTATSQSIIERMSGQGRNLEAGAEAEECCLLAFRGLVHYHHGRGMGRVSQHS